MSWRDRDYNQINFGGRQIRNPILNILFGSLPLGTWFGIRVRIHASLLLLIAGELLFAQARGGLGVNAALTYVIILFGTILLHEFGHCIACRMMGGSAEDILLWPLGGLASVHPPRRAWPTFVTIAGGPLVDVLICVACAIALFIMHPSAGIDAFNPLRGFLLFDHRDPKWLFAYTSGISYYIWYVYLINYSLILFNLLPMFPMDGAQILQTALWPKFGYYKSMMFTCMVGMVIAVLFGMFGLANRSILIVVLCFWGFMQSLRMRQMLLAHGPEEFNNEVDYSAAFENPGNRRKKMRKSWFKAARKRALREQSEQARIDSILAKVHEHGLHSLTWFEKRALKKATARQRERDLAERL